MRRNLLEIDLPWGLDSKLLRDIPCLICGSKGRKISSIVVNNIALGIRRCSNDGLMWLSPRPHQSFYDQLYEEHFYRSICPEQYGYATIDDESRREEKAKLNWNDIERESPIELKSDSFLEIGCATGEMLGEAISKGWRRVWGNELSGEAANRCRGKGYNVIEGDYSEIEISFRFELIFADNVIEHLMDPAHFISTMSSLLRKDGMLCLRLPNTPRTGPRLKLIDHTYHFGPKSLDLILHKSNLRIVKVIDSGIYYGSKGDSIQNMTVFSLGRL